MESTSSDLKDPSTEISVSLEDAVKILKEQAVKVTKLNEELQRLRAVQDLRKEEAKRLLESGSLLGLKGETLEEMVEDARSRVVDEIAKLEVEIQDAVGRLEAFKRP